MAATTNQTALTCSPRSRAIMVQAKAPSSATSSRTTRAVGEGARLSITPTGGSAGSVRSSSTPGGGVRSCG
ncbi:Uncharacterised protein [Mycobacteroides abscessus subsp. abscessus]|nr:Uncharacterised protein [Mycobacteroides abscessus subsp. abscessus]